jgi:hypothetical protein
MAFQLKAVRCAITEPLMLLCFLLQPKFDAIARCGQESDQHVCRDPLRITIRDSNHGDFQPYMEDTAS